MTGKKDALYAWNYESLLLPYITFSFLLLIYRSQGKSCLLVTEAGLSDRGDVNADQASGKKRQVKGYFVDLHEE